MNTPSADTSSYAIELDEQQSQQLLQEATRRGVEISVLPHTRADGLPALADIAGSTDEGLLIRPRDTTLGDPMSLISVYCEATMRLDDARFLFQTSVIDARQDDGEVRLEITKPSHVHVIQRRRFRRRGLRHDTRVSISPVGWADRPALRAALLNISTGGLACRIDRTDADACPADRPVILEFTVADCAETFCLPAHVCGRTPGAEEGQIILSVEFAYDAETEPQCERLSAALYHNVAALTGG